MDTKAFLSTIAPVIVFSIAALFLSYSVTTQKLLTFQNDAFIHLIRELKGSDLPASLSSTLSFMWGDILLRLSVFTALLSLGFFVFFLLENRVDSTLFLASMALVALAFFLLGGFSVFTLFVFGGIVLSALWLEKTFEPKKGAFSTGHSFSSSALRTVTLFLFIGFLAVAFSNIQGYQAMVSASNAALLEEMAGTSLKDAQKQQIDGTVESIKSSLKNQYDGMSSQVRQQCGPMYTGLVTGLEDYRKEAHRQVDETDLNSLVSSSVPGYGIFDKMGPLLSAFGLMVIFGALNFLASFTFALAYWVATNLHRDEQSMTSPPVRD
ncbi:hypothetical protein A3K63_02755 [Candidatus Micrarchaeota archaeon RBG_16_49_10]|nr:MAG: hypothetical protein A3K63_02755 [Candidatus Micrarchaeota archaeon RBG_16_49_10]